MDFLVGLFRDTLDGIWYYLYLTVCILAFFYVFGIVGDRKRDAINKKLKEKKTYDIESGREAEIAAMESKQILSAGLNSEGSQQDQTKQEEAPAVMVLDSDETPPANNPSAGVAPAQVQVAGPTFQPAVQPSIQPAQASPAATTAPAQPKAEEPLVLNSN